MKSKNTIPKGVDAVISLGGKALTGARAEDAEDLLVINTEPKLAADLYDMTGNPATPLVPGKQALYVAQKAAVADAYAAGRVAVNVAREFCQFAVGVLKRVLGTKWNSQWNTAGFTAPTLEVPRDPVPTLARLRAYFTAHPEHEVASLSLTAAAAQLRFAEVQQANLAIGRARELLVARKKARDEAFAKLRKRLSGLRAELDQLLPKTDGRWYAFGFHRPSDGTKPAPVKSVTVTPVGPGAVLVTWPPSALAESYRVTSEPSDRARTGPNSSDSTGDGTADGASDDTTAGESTATGIGNSSGGETEGVFFDTQATLLGLPTGELIKVSVSARNRSGETAPAQATIIVP